MSLRNRKTSKETTNKISNTSNQRVENSWVLLIKDSLLKNGNFLFVKLPHPATKKLTNYCLDENQNKLYEIVSFREPHRAWFIGETVKSDGSLQLLTPMNPLFLVLPRLKEKCIERAIPLQDLLSEKGFDKIINYVNNLDLVADLKGPEDINAYKYNENKTLEWLENKIRDVARIVREKQVHVTSGSASATFVTSNVQNDSVDNEFYLKYAFGIVSEYLEDDICEKIEKRFNFKPDLIETIGKKRKSEMENISINKKVKYENAEENIDMKSEIDMTNFLSDSTNKKQKSLTAKEKARQKAASGSKTISAFFTKKT